MSLSKTKRLALVLKTVCILASWNALMSFLQIIVGFLASSDALFADGLHTLLDLIMDGITYLACRLASRPPDQKHAYGYKRIETLACLVLSILLCLIGLGIVYDALFARIINTVRSDLVVYVSILTMIVNELLYRYSHSRSVIANSDLLAASALHQRTDALSSLIVFVSAVMDTLIPNYNFDSYAAMIIGLFIMKMGMKIAYKGILELLDAGIEPKKYQKLVKFMQSSSGVCDVHCLRTRKQAGDICLDVHIITDPFISVSEGHYIGEKLRRRIMKNFNDIVDVVVHIDPEDDTHLHDSDSKLPNRQYIGKILDSFMPQIGYSFTIHYVDEMLYVDVMSHSVVSKMASKKILKTIQHDFLQNGYDVEIRFFVLSSTVKFANADPEMTS
ncbi:MAG: cation diffusion facilitator family transporter [Pseudomonadota bacterium]|nr:cation diffusion facilitator family transporter [Pseudomonadota bacterium]